MKKILLAIAIVELSVFNFQLVHAQTWPVNDPVIMEVGGEKIRQSEFMKEFMSAVGNKLAQNPQTPQAEKRDALREYVDLFANFRAKVIDAKAMGLDTTAGLRAELKKYRAELAAPYLIDSSALESLLRQAYERNGISVSAAHILVRVAQDAEPADTMEALNHARELRKRIMDGEDFYAVAREDIMSKDPSARVRPNEGYLGYFTSFDMVYPFENAAYGMEIGEVSNPVRTRYGYHIIKLLDRVNMHGKCDIAHIWIGTRDSVIARNTINACYKRLNDGVDFAMVARQSDDRSTRDNGGLMANATLSNIPPEYIHVIDTLKTGEYSAPFHTQYGWHIVKLIRKDTLPSYEEMVPYYKQKMTRDQRSDPSRKSFAQKARVKYGVVDLTKEPVAAEQPKKKGKKVKAEPVKMQASLDELYAVVPEKVMMGKWDDYSDTLIKDIHAIVHVPDREYTTLDLLRYINAHRQASRLMKVDYYVNMRLDEFIDSVTVVYADSQLEKENPEFAAIVDEYRRGLMIFSYNDKMIWGKAIQDTVGFAEFYDRYSKTRSMTNRDDSVYFWRHRARVSTYDIADSSLLAPEKAKGLLTKALKKNKGSMDMKEMLQKAIGKKTTDQSAVRMDVDLVEMGRTKLLGEGQWQRGVYLSPNRHGYRAVVVEEVVLPMMKTQKEARGYYLNEYQNEIERQLNASLRQKYNVKINQDVVESIVY